MRMFILVLLVAFPLISWSQDGQIKGRVLDAVNNEPLPYANIFINNTTLGTSTNLQGEFLINNVTDGTHEVIFSFVGYQSYQARVIVAEGKHASLIIRLLPDEKQLENIEVTSSRDKVWEKQLNQFEKIFLGTTPNSLQCSIINPWVLNFKSNDSATDPLFTATASQPIEINNVALGYHIFFYMKDFKAGAQNFSILGNFKFEEMKTTDPKMAARWKKNRSDAYYGSDRHLFKAILDNRLKEDGFQLYKDKSGYEGSTVRTAIFSQEINRSITKINTDNIVSPGNRPGVFRIAMKGRIEIHYLNQVAPKKVYRDIPHVVGWLETSSGHVDVNANGVPLNTTDLVTSGYISADRVADLLPNDYVPDTDISLLKKEGIVSVDNAKFLRLKERVYLHTDKAYYYPGEVIWFKGYVNYQVPDLADSLSRVLHVELIDPDHSISQQSQWLIDSGRVAGQFILPDTLQAGAYYLRAYTNWMLNFPKDEIFIKSIPVLQLREEVILQPAAEKQKSDVSVSLQPDKEFYQPREKVSLMISITDQKNNALLADLSVSVTDMEQAVPVPDEVKIMEAYDFRNQHLNDSIIIRHPMEYGISISGLFRNDKGKSEKTKITAIQGKMEDITTVETDDGGRFFINGFHFNDTAQFAFQAKNAKGKPFGKVELQPRTNLYKELIGKPLNLKIQRSDSPQRYPTNQIPENAKILEEVVITSAPIDEKRTKQGIVYGKPDYVLTGEQLFSTSANQNLLVALQGKVPGLQITSYWEEGFQQYIIKIRGGSNILNLAQGKEVFEPVIIVNGVPFGGGGSTAAQQLEQISAFDVERVEVITRANPLLGVRGTNGAIAIYTKSGSLTSGQVQPVIDQTKIQVIPVKGFDVPLKFIMPDYLDEKADHSQPDFRSTIYWAPWVKISSEGNTKIEFFTADLPTKYRVVVEGVTMQGNPFHDEAIIEIKSR